ncbi:MAG: ABC transporter permease [Clostridiaceae bacterium]
MQNSLIKYIDLYYTFIKNCLMREMEYRGNYILMVFTTAFLNIYFLVYYLVLVNRTGNNFLGWNKYELLFFMATEVICHSMFMAFCFYNVFSLPEQVRTGNFDFILLKPISARFLLSTRNFNFSTFTQILLGIGIAIYSLFHLDVKIDALKIIIYIAFILNSVFIMYLIGFTLMTLSFFFTKVSSSGSILPYRGFFALYWFARRPEEIYTNTMIRALTYGIPLLVLINLPSKWIVKSVDLNTIIWSIVVTPVFFIISQLLWRYGIKHYSSASS